MINSFAINSAPINGTSENVGKLLLELQVKVSSPTQVAQMHLPLKIVSFNRAIIALPLSIEVHHPAGQISLPIHVNRYATSSLELPLSIHSVELSNLNQQSLQWKIRLIIDGIDVSSNLTDSLRVEAEEGAAKIAEFTLVPFSGQISVTKWLGKQVLIYFQAFKAEQKYPSEWIIFQGVIDEPVYDPTSRLTKFICTDQLQEKVSSLSTDDISELLNGYWSPLVSDTTDDNWQYAQDLLSSVPSSLELDRYHELKVTPWRAKQVPDLVFNEDNIFYQSIEVQLANRREIHNIMNLSAQYRFPRLKQREIIYEYQYPYSFCGQSHRNSTLPNVDMISQAVEGTGWHLQDDIHYVHQRGSGWVSCGGVVFGYLISEELRKHLVRDAYFRLSKRYVQSITEQLELIVESKNSIKQFGEIPMRDSLTYSSQVNIDKFTQTERYEPPLDGSTLDEAGDYVFDADARNELNLAIITKLNQAKTSIQKSHRNNLVSFKASMSPFIERDHTIRLDTANVTAQGKVRHIIHECDFNLGKCETSVTFSISRTDNDEPRVAQALVAPDKISNPVNGDLIIRTILPSHLGGKLNSPLYDENWDGYIGNEHPEVGAQPYQERFIVPTPAIEKEQIPGIYHASTRYHIDVPNELLLLSA